jgi:hypothetical protein
LLAAVIVGTLFVVTEDFPQLQDTKDVARGHIVAQARPSDTSNIRATIDSTVGGLFLLVVVTNSPEPYYNAQRYFWRLIAKKDPRVRVVFVNDDPDVTESAPPRLVGDDLFAPGAHGALPGNLVKVMAALRFFEGDLKNFKFVLKTNLSSFWVWALFLKWIEAGGVQIPTYAGVEFSIENGVQAASGAGMLMSVDLALQLHHNRAMLDFKKYDDVAIAELMAVLGHGVQTMPRRDFLGACTGPGISHHNQPDNVEFHFRIKCDNRIIDDAAHFARLYDTYYRNNNTSLS